MAPFIDAAGRTYIKHPNGQTTHYILDDFLPPWQANHPTVLIQHGFARHAAFWHHWIPALSRRYRVIRRDARGHGYSSFPTPLSPYPYDLDTILAEMVDTLDQLGVERVHFLGESTSGMLAEALAARHPDRLLSVTVCSSPTHLPPQALDLFAFGEPSWPAACRKFGARGWAQRLARVPGTVSSEDPAYLEWWLDQIGVATGEGLAGYAAFLEGLDARPFLGEIKVPMLILAPRNSAAVKVEEQRELQGLVEGARLVVVEGKGHEIYTEKAEECQEAFLKFLDEVERKE